MPPARMICHIAILMRSVPGTGLCILLKIVYFWAQYINPIPKTANIGTIGCNGAKKQENKNKLTI